MITNQFLKIWLLYVNIRNCLVKFPLWNLNINNLMPINFSISLITQQFFRYFDRHSNKTVTISELLQHINNFSKTIVHVIRKSHEFSFKIVQVIMIVVSNQVDFRVNARLWRQSIASWYSMMPRFSSILLLSPPSCILFTLVVFIANARLKLVYLGTLRSPLNVKNKFSDTVLIWMMSN